jgi:hypothetical protein
MSRAGRKPLGPALVHNLEGSEQAKQRLEVILETIAGRLTIEQACQRLGIGEAMFHRLRTEVLEAGLARLEPRPMGRPRQPTTPEQRRSADLEQQLAQLESELKLAAVREEITRVMPHLSRGDPPLKKTILPAQKPQGRRPTGPRKKHQRPTR